MKRVLNIKALESLTGLSSRKISELLFPEHKNPILALRYVARGDRELTYSEVLKLEELSGSSADEFYPREDSAPTWRPGVTKSGMTYTRGRFEITYNVSNGEAIMIDTRTGEVASQMKVLGSLTLTEFFEHFNKVCSTLDKQV